MEQNIVNFLQRTDNRKLNELRNPVKDLIWDIMYQATEWDLEREVDMEPEGVVDELSIRAHNYCVMYENDGRGYKGKWRSYMTSHVYRVFKQFVKRSDRMINGRVHRTDNMKSLFSPFLLTEEQMRQIGRK